MRRRPPQHMLWARRGAGGRAGNGERAVDRPGRRPCASALGVGGLLYGALFYWIVVGAPDVVAEVWFALLLGGALLSVPVAVALYLRLRAVDEGMALTALLLGLAGALGGAVHGA